MFGDGGTRPGGVRERTPPSGETPYSVTVMMLYPDGRPQAVSDATMTIVTITSQNNLFFTCFIPDLIIRLMTFVK